jgi:chromosome partitioning protein
MKVIAIVARKGGVGKTSLVRSLAVQAAIDGLRPAILDADEQQTIVRWSKRREAKVPAIFDLKAGSIAKAVEQIRAKSADVCFIDCPPHNAPSINVAVELADFALIVTEPAAESIEQIASVVAIAKGLKRPTGILINKAPPKSNALTLTRSALTAFDGEHQDPWGVW